MTCLLTAQAQPKVLTLDKVQLTNVSIPFRIKSVIDARKDKSNIGWVQTGIANKKRFAILDRPLDQELKELLDRSNLKTETDFIAVLRIDHLSVSEQTTAMSETALAEVAISFFVEKNDTSYYNVGSFFANYTSKGMDVTVHHPANVAKALEQAFRYCGKPTKDEILDTTRYTYDEIKDANKFRIDVESLPIVTTDTYENGLFLTLSEFRINKPSIKTGYEVTEGKNFKARWTSGGKK